MMHAIIMGGGQGTRFWPKSTSKKPKQFLALDGKDSMLRTTVDRLTPLIPKKNIFFIGNKNHLSLVSSVLSDLPSENIISEPIGRNTAPCLGLASIYLRKRDPNATAVAVPSDHIITKNKKFLSIVKKSLALASKEEVFVTIGIPPNLPHTGFGYIQKSRELKGYSGFYNVKRFVEKPNFATAKKYLASGNYYWNSGMFIFSVNTMLKAIAECLPLMYSLLMRIEAAIGSKSEKRVLHDLFPEIQSISIDYGIMEKVKNVVITEGAIGWSDVGSWAALETVKKKDKCNNIITGNVLHVDSSGNIVEGGESLIALLDVHNMIIVQTDDATLIAPKESSEKVKVIVDNLLKKKQTEYL